MDKYTSYLMISFKADNRDEMYDKIWELEKLLEVNDYEVHEHHTAKTNDLRMVTYGRNI